jgi:hypothetical protein
MPTFPIQLRRNGTASATPSSLLHGEVALNYADSKLFWKDSSNVIQSFTFTAYALSSHSHGNITSAGAIGSTANLPVITTTSGVLTTGSFGSTANTFCQGNDSRLSDTRTPTDGSVSTAKLANDAVTYAKMQNVSVTDRLLGRSTAGAGDIEEIVCTAAGRALIDDASSAAQLTTLGAAPAASPTFTGVVTVAAGSAAAPSVVITGDSDTGIAQIGGANSLSIVTAGTERLRVSSVGNVGIGLSSNAAVAVEVSASAGESIRLTNVTGSERLHMYTRNVAATSRIESQNSDLQLFTFDANALIFGTSNVERARIDTSGNLRINGANAATSAAGAIHLKNGTAPTASITDGVVLFAADVSLSSELRVRDEAGNTTTLSPHNFSLIPEGPSEPMAWAYYSERDGHRINVDMLRLARLVEMLTGEKLVYEEDPT